MSTHCSRHALPMAYFSSSLQDLWSSTCSTTVSACSIAHHLRVILQHTRPGLRCHLPQHMPPHISTSNPRPTSRPTTGMAHPHVPTTDTAHFYVFSTHSFPTHLSTPPSTSDEEDDDDAAQPPKHTLLHPIFSTRSLHQPVRVRRMTAFCVCQLLPLRTSTTLRIPTC